MHFRTLFFAAATLPLIAGAAAADNTWTAATSPTLTAHANEEESDRNLFAVCPIRSIVELYVGANEQVGKGEGEAVTLRLESDGKSATLSGVSRRSYNFEMTGGTELVTRVSSDDDVFKVFATGKAVKVSGSMSRPVTWTDKGMARAVKKFMRDCTRR